MDFVSVSNEVANTILGLGIVYTTYKQSALEIPNGIFNIFESEIFMLVFALLYMRFQIGSGNIPTGAFFVFALFRFISIKYNRSKKIDPEPETDKLL